MKIFSNYNYDQDCRVSFEVHKDTKSFVIPGQAYSVEELLRRSVNGTFPDLNSYDQVDFPGRTPEDMSVPDSPQDYNDDHSPEFAMQEAKRIKSSIDTVLKKQQINKVKLSKQSKKS